MQALCGADTYGSPRFYDCRRLLDSFAPSQDISTHVFDEEQIRSNLKGSWKGIADIVGSTHLKQVVQIPRFFSMSEFFH